MSYLVLQAMKAHLISNPAPGLSFAKAGEAVRGLSLVNVERNSHEPERE